MLNRRSKLWSFKKAWCFSSCRDPVWDKVTCYFQVTTTSNHCWLHSLLDSPTDTSSQGLYNVFLIPAQTPQHLCTALQSHLFGTKMKALVLCRKGNQAKSCDVGRRVTKWGMMIYIDKMTLWSAVLFWLYIRLHLQQVIPSEVKNAKQVNMWENVV